MPWAIARASWMVASTTPFDADRRPCLLREDSHSGPGQERQMPLPGKTMPILHIAAPGPLERCGGGAPFFASPGRSALSFPGESCGPGLPGIVLSDDFPEIDEHRSKLYRRGGAKVSHGLGGSLLAHVGKRGLFRSPASGPALLEPVALRSFPGMDMDGDEPSSAPVMALAGEDRGPFLEGQVRGHDAPFSGNGAGLASSSTGD